MSAHHARPVGLLTFCESPSCGQPIDADDPSAPTPVPGPSGGLCCSPHCARRAAAAESIRESDRALDEARHALGIEPGAPIPSASEVSVRWGR